MKYEYTAENRLAAVSQGGTVLMAAMYDSDNNRVFQIENTYRESGIGEQVSVDKVDKSDGYLECF